MFLQESHFYEVDVHCSFLAGAYFTTKTNFVFVVSNRNADQGELMYFDGTFNHDEIMLALCGMVIKNFSASTFRQKRRMILDFCNLIQDLMKRIDNAVSFSETSNEISYFTIQIDKYATLSNVDWIEEKMDEWYQLQGTSNYVMVPFQSFCRA